MGFEVILHYREKNEEGEFDEEVKTKKIKVGSAHEEIGLDACAGKIIAQLANRKRLIEDVEIYEFTKKKLNYKETEDGILIKGKKFRFDDGPAVSSSSNAEQQLAELLAANPNLLQQLQQAANGQQMMPHQQQMPMQSQHPVVQQQPQQQPSPVQQPHQNNIVSQTMTTVTRQPIREEEFNPPHPDIAEIERSRFRVGKSYPVYEVIERGTSPFTRIFYVVGDENGNTVKKPAEFFTPPRQKLKHEDELNKSVYDGGGAPAEDIKLDYGDNQWEGVIPDIETLKGR